jgi:hypothetical protein
MRIKLCGLIACAAMLAAGVVSCQQHDDIPQGVKYPILFDSPDTRATATIDDLKNNGFMVYAYVDGNVNDITFNKVVKYNESRDVWAFETPEYWIPHTNYSFKAFYPSSFTAGQLSVDTTKTDLNFKITGFDVVNYQEDILVASAAAVVPEGKAYPEKSIVDLDFKHLLACIEIKIKSAVSGVRVESITIEGADNLGTYTSDSNKWVSTNKDEITIDSGVDLALNAAHVNVTGDGILVIPASAEGKTLLIKTRNGATEKKYSVEFPEDNEWKMGNKYTYTAEIKQDYIVFNEPDVDEWDSENATGSVIIK